MNLQQQSNLVWPLILRIIITQGESLQDIILKYLYPYLKLSNSTSCDSNSSKSFETLLFNEDDLLLHNIFKQYRFEFTGGQYEETEVTHKHLSHSNTFNAIQSEDGMYLEVRPYHQEDDDEFDHDKFYYCFKLNC